MSNIGTADRIGATAKNLLTAPGFSARVLAVVSGAVYLQCDVASPAGAKQSPTSPVEIIWLAQNHLPMHPRAISGDFDFAGLHVGVRHAVLPHIPNTPVWSPPEISRAQIAPREIMMAQASEIQAPQGFRASEPCGALRDLIGLGEGLTPAGDDFVGGVLFARWHLRAAYPGLVTWDQRAVDELMAYARPRTNAISYAILRDHARGQSIAPLHELMAAMLTGGNREEIQPSIEQLAKIGSSTGHNLMAGVITGARESLTPIHY